MLAFLVRRTLLAAFTIWVVSVVAFLIIVLPPGDWIQNYALQELELWAREAYSEKAIRELKVVLREKHGLNKPLPVQYLKWAGNVIRGDFGKSMEHRRPIRAILGDRMLMTVLLALATVLFTWTMAIPIGIHSAVRQ